MARTLTKKQKGFVKDILDGNTGTKAVLNNYDTKDSEVAKVIASQNLTKPPILEVLRDNGFNEITADNVVASILVAEYQEPQVRLKAAELVYKRMGSYAAEKSYNLSVNATVEDLQKAIMTDIARFKAKE